MSGRDDRDGDNGLIWRLPQVKSKQLGKLGPGFGFGAGCGVGFGLGLLGGAGIGPGIPGLQLGFGLGVGCGVGLGFGYGLGKGVAHDERRRYSNVGSIFHSPTDYPTRDDIGALVDDFVRNTKKIIEVTSREIDKWGR